MNFKDSHKYRCKATGKNGKSHDLTLFAPRALSACEVIDAVTKHTPKGALASLEVMETLLPDPTRAEIRADQISFEQFLEGFTVQLFTRA
jgi:hypothetical protein